MNPRLTTDDLPMVRANTLDDGFSGFFFDNRQYTTTEAATDHAGPDHAVTTGRQLDQRLDTFATDVIVIAKTVVRGANQRAERNEITFGEGCVRCQCSFVFADNMARASVQHIAQP